MQSTPAVQQPGCEAGVSAGRVQAAPRCPAPPSQRSCCMGEAAAVRPLAEAISKAAWLLCMRSVGGKCNLGVQREVSTSHRPKSELGRGDLATPMHRHVISFTIEPATQQQQPGWTWMQRQRRPALLLLPALHRAAGSAAPPACLHPPRCVVANSAWRPQGCDHCQQCSCLRRSKHQQQQQQQRRIPDQRQTCQPCTRQRRRRRHAAASAAATC